MFLIGKLSFRLCDIVLFGHDHCRQAIISRFNNNNRRVTIERRNRHHLRFRQITNIVTVLISYRAKVFNFCSNILFISSFWHGGLQMDLTVKFSLDLVDLVP